MAFTFDLHVLGTPPAFILSQDQTLRKVILPSELLSLDELRSLNQLLLHDSCHFSIVKVRRRDTAYQVTNKNRHLPLSQDTLQVNVGGDTNTLGFYLPN